MQQISFIMGVIYATFSFDIIAYIFRDCFNTDFISVVSWGIFISIYYLHKKILLLKYLLLNVYIWFALIGVLGCENLSIYLHELGYTTSHQGSFPLIVIYFKLCYLTILWGENTHIFESKSVVQYKYKAIPLIKLIMPIILSTYFFIGLFMFATISNRPYWFLNIDRYIYINDFLPPYILSLRSILILFSPVILLPFVSKKKISNHKLLCLLTIFTPFFLFNIWIGNKFFEHLQLISIAILPAIIAMSKLNDISLKKVMIICGAVLLTGVSITGAYYSNRNKNTSPIDIIKQRIIYEGQMWWAIYNKEYNKPYRINEYDNEILAPLTNYYQGKKPKLGFNYGVWKIMRYVTKPEIYNRRIARRDNSVAQYSLIGPEKSYYYLKECGVLLHGFFHGFLFWITTNLLIKMLQEGRFLETILAARLFLKAFSIITYEGLWIIFSKGFILDILMLLILQIIYTSKKKGSIKL